MKIEILDDPDSAALRAAEIIAAAAREAVAARGRFILAVSGGRTPWEMLRTLAGEKMPWDKVHLVQVDERVAPAGHTDRNLTHLRNSLLAQAPLRPEHIHPMPVEAPDLEAAAKNYARTLGITDADVGMTAAYQGRRRMTLTYPILNRSRQVLWVVTGSDKAAMLARLRAGDRSIPAGIVRRNRALVIADHAAASALGQT